MKKDVTKLAISTGLLMAALVSLAFQGSDQDSQQPKPLVVKESSIAKQLKDSLALARKQFDQELKRNDSLWDERLANFKNLEKNVDELKKANKMQERAIGKLVQILTHFPADSTLNRFNLEEKSINTDSLKKKISLPEVEPPIVKKPSLFQRIFPRKHK